MAEFYKGFTFERDVKDRLTIEGNPVEAPSTMRAPTSTVPWSSGRASGSGRNTCGFSGATKPHGTNGDASIQRSIRCSLPMTSPSATPVWSSMATTSATRISLRRAFRGMSLRGANFHQAILAKADFAGAHLEESNFCRTDFYETNFEGA